jgi:hypothetical protein
MPDKSTQRDTSRRDTDITLTIGLVLAVLVVVGVIGASIFDGGKKGADVTATQPSTESPTTGDKKTP